MNRRLVNRLAVNRLAVNRLARHAAPLVVATLVAVGCRDGATDPSAQGIRVLVGADAADTVQSDAVTIAVEIRDTHGQTVTSGPIVTFTARPTTGATAKSRPAYVCARPSAFCGDATYANFASDRVYETPADGQGRASVAVRLGTVPGPTYIDVAVPELGLRDSVRVIVRAGRPFSIVGVPEDTAVLLGASFPATAHTSDRYGNALPDTVVLDGTSAGLQVSAQTVTATAYGPQEIRFTAGTARRSIAVAVVPVGTILTSDGTNLVVINSDGTGRRTIVPPGIGPSGTGFEPAWIGDEVLYSGSSTTETRLYVANAAGVSRRLITGGVPLRYESQGRATSAGDVYFVGADTGVNTVGAFLFRVPAGTSSAERVLSRGAPVSGYSPAPARAGGAVAFISGTSSDDFTLSLRSAAGAVTPTKLRAVEASYSPDGNRIAYITGFYKEFWVMNADGTGARLVSRSTSTVASYVGLSWTGDGRWLVSALSFRGPVELIEVETGLRMTLPYTRGLSLPAWKP
jgi:hypothetical protein